jgi:Fur family peroxide stress response transcriptional regulator
MTPQRIEIFREVAGRRDHPDAEAVLHGVRARMPSVSLDTVYRTLALFRELELVAARRPRRDSVRFDGRLDSHHHYVCTRCGRTWDLDASAVRVRQAPEACNALGSVAEARVEVRGICRDCSEVGTERAKPHKRGGTR